MVKKSICKMPCRTPGGQEGIQWIMMENKKRKFAVYKRYLKRKLGRGGMVEEHSQMWCRTPGAGLEKIFISLQAGQSFPWTGQISLQCEMVSLMYFFYFFPLNHKISWQGASCLPIFSLRVITLQSKLIQKTFTSVTDSDVHQKLVTAE